MSDSLPLARRLSALDDDALTALLVIRHVPSRDVRDFFDLADALLEPASVRLALRPLDRATIAALAGDEAAGESDAPGRPAETLITLGLAEAAADSPRGFRAYSAAAEVATAVLTEAAPREAAAATPRAAAPSAIPEAAAASGEVVGLPEASPEVPAGLSPAVAAPSTDALASERAFIALSAISELGQQLRTAPMRLLARGGLSAGEEKRLGALLAVEPATIGALVEVATAARLVVVDVDTLLSTTRADEWSRLPSAERWLALATAWIGSLDEPVRRALHAAAATATGNSSGAGAEWSSGAPLRAAYSALFPAADDAMRAGLAQVDAVAELLGLTVDGRSTLFGRAALAASAVDAASIATTASTATPTSGTTAPSAAATRDLDALTAALPPEVAQVYLQHDLSVIAPGPLVPPVDARIRLLADLENRGVASTYRISQPTIDRALASGETETSLREFLAATSLTGLPQALDYLLAEGGRRHGLVRVRRLGEAPVTDGSTPTSSPYGARTLIRTTDRGLLGTIAVDQSLAPLGLRRDDDGSLSSRVDATATYWLLVDARYPVLAEDAEGRELVMRRARVAVAPTEQVASATGPRADNPAAVAEFVRRLRESSARSAPGDESAWVARQLDKAVRSRTPVTIAVRMPDGSTVRLDVTPLSLSNGRLRCVDVRAGIERTVPVANIQLIAAAE
ncbi:helicase-associated domain-containing protein [Herbiconiux sp. CPCC 205763]|uniref:Helicase-associated domain-containing protein n=1 Tax=Herbiconiux aconitum TaxID=2970913 RepID=A0ABT2GQ52_9MICO|nr:helicase-associated domain-containing protein [Herbiconiux aconitum]MCS5718359.1 helicase-associated domain-containing protein [Herbiconiux aconitum]